MNLLRPVWIPAKSVLEQEVVDLVKRTDLEEETIVEVVRILKEEFED
jgi:N utilization substance protein A